MDRVSGETVVRTDGDAIDVLHLDDDQAFLDLTARWLETRYEGLTVQSTTEPAEALSLLGCETQTDGGVEAADQGSATREAPGSTTESTVDDPPFDCVVSDYDMPGIDGLEFLEQVREHYPDLPFVLFTGKGSEEIASEAISAGVTDYLQKGTGGDRFTVLANRIENAVSQRRAERQAERSAERIRQVFERTTDAFVATDSDLRYTYANEQALELLDTDRNELIGTSMLEAFPEVEGTTFLDAFEQAMREQEPVTVEDYFQPLDTWFEIRVFPARDGLSVYFRDVTERKERERRFNAIFNNTYQFTGLMEPDGTLVEANETALEFGGIEREDVVGDHLAEAAWITEENRERVYDATRRAREGEFVRFEMEINGAEGPVVIDFSLKPVTDERGEVTLLIPEGRDITDLKERERQFHAVFNNTYQFTGLMEPDGTLIKANDTALEFAGVEAEDVIGKHLAETAWITEANRDRVYDAVGRAREGEFVRFEMEIDGADGRGIIDFSLKPITDDEGAVELLIPEGREITERKHHEEELERTADLLNRTQNIANVGGWEISPDDQSVVWTDEVYRILGLPLDEEPPLEEAFEVYHPDDRPVIEAAVEGALEEGEPFDEELRVVRPDGEIRWVRVLGEPTVEGGTVETLRGAFQDITERRERERKFEAVFNNTFQFTGLMEPDGTLVEANDTALAFGGIAPEDVIGKKVWNTHWFQVDEETPEQVRQDVERAREGEFVRYELEVQGAEGTAVIDFSLKPITDEQGEVVLIVPEGRDITELKERERELERKNERLEAFTSVVSHDLKNPLGVAQGNLQLFRQTGGEDLELVAEAEAALDRMEQLIEDLLDLAEKGRVVDDARTVALGDVVRHAASTIDTSDIDLRMESSDLTVDADRERLMQLLENLLDNAAEHATDRVQLTVLDDEAAIAVEDDGPGVPPGKREEIFQPGFSTDEDGHGFGLAIARNIAEAHGWSLDVTDSDLGGARFVVRNLQMADSGSD